MNVPFFIASKYFLSTKKKSFINFISIISMLGVAVGLSALIIILSVFNGLEDLNRQIFKSFDPDLKISAKQAKTFIPDQELIESLKNMEEVAYISEVLQDKALARNGDYQTIIDVRGVDSSFKLNNDFRKALLIGEMDVYKEEFPAAFLGIDVFNSLQLGIADFLNPIEVLYPRNQKVNLLNPESNINDASMIVSGVFMLEQHYDNFLFMPLEEMEDLTESWDKRSAIEISLQPNARVNRVKRQVAALLDDNLVVKDRDEQNESLLKAIKLEKLFIFIGLIFIVGIAAFNIFYALSMLVLDKKDDIETLSSLGADASFIRRIFIIEGFIISGIGVIAGLIIGLGVVWMQQKFGFVGLGVDYAITDSYPVRIMLSDVLLSIVGIWLITFLASLIPARKAPDFMY